MRDFAFKVQSNSFELVFKGEMTDVVDIGILLTDSPLGIIREADKSYQQIKCTCKGIKMKKTKLRSSGGCSFEQLPTRDHPLELNLIKIKPKVSHQKDF